MRYIYICFSVILGLKHDQDFFSHFELSPSERWDEKGKLPGYPQAELSQRGGMKGGNHLAVPRQNFLTCSPSGVAV